MLGSLADVEQNEVIDDDWRNVAGMTGDVTVELGPLAIEWNVDLGSLPFGKWFTMMVSGMTGPPLKEHHDLQLGFNEFYRESNFGGSHNISDEEDRWGWLSAIAVPTWIDMIAEGDADGFIADPVWEMSENYRVL